ncbi:hypothetical protein Tco_1010862 [Tanacetum coccineum]
MKTQTIRTLFGANQKTKRTLYVKKNIRGGVVVVRGCDSRGGGVVAVVRWRCGDGDDNDVDDDGVVWAVAG